MSKGIDLSSQQAGITVADLAGQDWVIVKAGGFNVKPMYVAPHYHEQIDTVLNAGLSKGHYWVVGNGDPAVQAKYFVNNLYKFDKDHDVLVLDNERLDGNAGLFTDDQIATFASVVIAATGIKPHRFWLYMGAYELRQHDYPKTRAIGINSPWVASYGQNNGTRTEPDLGGKFPSYVAHQYTSNGKAGKYTVDLSYSPLGVDKLFKDPIVDPAITAVSFVINPDGTIWLVDPVAKTKAHILPAQWSIFKQLKLPVLKVSVAGTNRFKTI